MWPKLNYMGMKRPRRVMLFEDILEHSVLPWLPAKSLIRFKCVSRRWCDLISNKFFILQQYRRCTAPRSLIYQGWDVSNAFFTGLSSAGIPAFPLHLEVGKIRMLASCNGLVVIYCSHTDELRVGNPVLQDWKMIPSSGVLRFILWIIGLAFDPVDSVGCYEVVCPYPIDGASPYFKYVGFMVLSSKTGEWKKSKSVIDIPPKSKWRPGHAVFLCGKLYWPSGVDVLWFDTKRDCSGMIPSPIKECHVRICHLDGGSKHGLTYTRFYKFKIDIWAMKEQQWLKLYHVEIEDIVNGNLDIFDVKYREPFYAGFMCFGGKVIFFAMGNLGFVYDVENGETTRFPGYVSPTDRYIAPDGEYVTPRSRWSPFKSNLIPLPRRSWNSYSDQPKLGSQDLEDIIN